jgi:hypothetical protein
MYAATAPEMMLPTTKILRIVPRFDIKGSLKP